MNKAQLIEKLAHKTNMTKVQTESLMDAYFEIIQKTVSKGEEVKIVGFGTFSVAHRGARKGRNPKTGQSVEIPRSKVPRFKAGKEFKDALS